MYKKASKIKEALESPPVTLSTENVLNQIFKGKTRFDLLFISDESVTGNDMNFHYKVVKVPHTKRNYKVYVMEDGKFNYIATIQRLNNTFWVLEGKIYKNFWNPVLRLLTASSLFGLFLHLLYEGSVPANFRIWFSGYCIKCGRPLTVSKSQKRGFGPKCYEEVVFKKF